MEQARIAEWAMWKRCNRRQKSRAAFTTRWAALEFRARLGSGRFWRYRGLCQPVERDLFDCYLGCAWPAQVPDHVSNTPDWTSKCSAAVNDGRNVDVVYP